MFPHSSGARETWSEVLANSVLGKAFLPGLHMTVVPVYPEREGGGRERASERARADIASYKDTRLSEQASNSNLKI